MLKTIQYREDRPFLALPFPVVGQNDVLLSIVLLPWPIRTRELGLGATGTIVRESNPLHIDFVFLSFLLFHFFPFNIRFIAHIPSHPGRLLRSYWMPGSRAPFEKFWTCINPCVVYTCTGKREGWFPRFIQCTTLSATTYSNWVS